MAHRHEAQHEHQRRTGDQHHRLRPPQPLPRHHHRSPRQRRDGVEVGAQHHRDPRDQDVAGDAPADAGQHPQQHRAHRSESRGQCLGRAGHGEQAQADRVE
jgi:hypothetical protein